MPDFKNLEQESGLTELNTFLATRSYVDGSEQRRAEPPPASRLLDPEPSLALLL